MNLKQYITFFAIGTAIGWSAWILVVLSIDPSAAGALGILMFYISLTIGLSGLLTTISTLIRFARYPDRDTEEVVLTSLRQGFLLTILVICALILLSFELLFWWSVLIIVFIIALVELAFIVKKKGVQG
ncbi:MAG: hypothetical protein ABH826_02860 [Patescibacteria group bacterium]|nr:hypothetical protein [Patescibacteria group bacterium]